jgi:hypothetical protein
VSDIEKANENESRDENASGLYPGRALTAERLEDEPAEVETEAEPEVETVDAVEGEGVDPVEAEGVDPVEAEAAGDGEDEDDGGRAPFDADMTGYLPAIQDPPAAEPGTEPAGLTEPDAVDTGFDAAEPAVEEAAAGRAGDERLARMQEIQLGFIDDPRRAALDAQKLLEDVLRSLAEDLYRQRDELQNAPLDGAPDTERMRLAVRRSRQLVETLTEA